MEISRQCVVQGVKTREALNGAIDYCLEHGILYETLREQRAEVLGMLLDEFDVDKYERTIRWEGREEGIERFSGLTKKLLDLKRIDDLERATQDSRYREKLFKEFNL